ncbi:hypothetical protein ACSBR2_023460 [Camellia fascicularis]
MGSIPSELSLDVRPTYVPKTISDFLGELTAIDSVSDRLLRLDDFVQRLDDERRKIDAFKRELPLCMLLLNDAIATLKEESKQCRPRNVEPVLEEFIPLKKNCDENEKSEAKKEKDSGGDKMNWMSSVQLWNTDNLKNIDSKTDQKQNSVPKLREPWNLSIASNPQGPSSIPSAQISQAFSKPAPDVTSQSSSMEVKPSGRTELPENLFAATYPSSVPVPGWQTGPPQGYGFNMQYNNTAMVSSTPQHNYVDYLLLSLIFNYVSQIIIIL